MRTEAEVCSNASAELISLNSTGTDNINTNTIEKVNSVNERFFLRKRKSVNYNPKTKRFEYEGDDSDYEAKEGNSKKKPSKQQKKKSNRHSKPGKANKTNKTSTDKKLRVNADPVECREFQLSGLMNWKNYEDTNADIKLNDSEINYFEFDDITSVNLNNYAEDLEAILVNPPWENKTTAHSKLFNMDNFVKLNLPLKKMKEGLIFVWTEKEYISDLVYYFEEMGIKYVENLVWVALNPENKSNHPLRINNNFIDKSSLTADPFNINDLFKSESYTSFTKSSLTLLIFRKFLPSNKRYLELRHQRSGDACFDYYTPYYYIYRLIEILLPKANYNEEQPLRMMEM